MLDAAFNQSLMLVSRLHKFLSWYELVLIAVLMLTLLQASAMECNQNFHRPLSLPFMDETGHCLCKDILTHYLSGQHAVRASPD